MFILDSFALLCLFDLKRKKENRAVRKYLEDAEKEKIKLFLSKINEGEVFYKLYKHLGGAVAIGFREDIKRRLVPIEIVSISDKRVERASEIKAKYAVSYADAFCIELANDMSLPVITGDPEFRNVQGILKVIWI